MWRARFDARGNEIERSYFGTDGGPCPHMLGVATKTTKYDDRGNIVEVAYFDLSGNPCLHKLENYSRFQAQFDERGNTIKKSYFGMDGKPCLHKDGYAGFSEDRDELGNLVKRTYVDVEGKIVRTVGSPAMMNNKGVIAVMAESDSAAAQKGVKLGDVLLELGAWKFFPQRNFARSEAELRLAMDLSKPREKRVVLFRPGSSSLIQYDFGPGSIGLNLLETLWPGKNLKDVREAYEKYVREREAAKQGER